MTSIANVFFNIRLSAFRFVVLAVARHSLRIAEAAETVTKPSETFLHAGAWRDSSVRAHSVKVGARDSFLAFSDPGDVISSYISELNSSGYYDSQEASESPVNSTADHKAPRRQLVVSKYDEDISWLQSLPNNFDVKVYQSRDPSGPNYLENVGNEAYKYLEYIIENYEQLPESVIFLQAGRQDWHDPLPKDQMLKMWDWDRAAQSGGIAFLPTNAPCLIEDSIDLPPHERGRLPDGERCIAVTEHSPPQMATVRQVWGDIFEPELGQLPQRWLTHCCAQFEVTRDAILAHPLDFYARLSAWIKNHDSELLASTGGVKAMNRNHDELRRDAGHVMEVVWVLLFSSPRSRIELPSVLPVNQNGGVEV